MERKVKVVIVTGADEAYAAGVLDIAERFAAHRERGEVALACLNLGMSATSLASLMPLADRVVQPAWDLPVRDTLRMEEPHLRALTARPFLRDYFPGYDVYLWIDADVLVQQPQVAHWYVDGALQRGMALVPQVHHAYRHTESAFHWRMNRLTAYFDKERARDFLWQTYYNAGVFALTAGAPHWEAWARYFREGLARCDGAFVCDQTALNEAVHREQLGVTALPATANWLCHLAMPVQNDSTHFVEPAAPNRLLGFVHFSAATVRRSPS